MGETNIRNGFCLSNKHWYSFGVFQLYLSKQIVSSVDVDRFVVVFIFPFLLFILIPDFSNGANINYFVDMEKVITFPYKCITTELLHGVTGKLYEVGCYPEYDAFAYNQTFFAPKTQDAATILCVRYHTDYKLHGLI